jgi:hypothetical protein
VEYMPNLRTDSLEVKKIPLVTRVHNDQHADTNDAKKHPRHGSGEKRRPRDFMNAILRAVEQANKKLAQAGLLYRCRVFEEGDALIIDLDVLDKNNNVVRETRRNITDEDFDRLIEDIAACEGLVVDRTG